MHIRIQRERENLLFNSLNARFSQACMPQLGSMHCKSIAQRCMQWMRLWTCAKLILIANILVIQTIIRPEPCCSFCWCYPELPDNGAPTNLIWFLGKYWHWSRASYIYMTTCTCAFREEWKCVLQQVYLLSPEQALITTRKVFIQCVYWCTGYVHTLLANCEAGGDVRQGTSEEPEGDIQPSLHSARVSRTTWGGEAVCSCVCLVV